MEQENKPIETGTEVEAPVMTFDEILEDKEYQREFDRRVTKATETAVSNAKAKWEKEFATKQAEADKLAKMDEEQKKAYEFEQLTSRAEKAERELNAFRLKEETTRQANERGIALAYLDTIDFSRETAESVNQKLDIFEKAFKAERERAINEYSKEPAPRTGDSQVQKSLNELKTYEEIKEYYEKHPEAK